MYNTRRVQHMGEHLRRFAFRAWALCAALVLLMPGLCPIALAEGEAGVAYCATFVEFDQARLEGERFVLILPGEYGAGKRVSLISADGQSYEAEILEDGSARVSLALFGAYTMSVTPLLQADVPQEPPIVGGWHNALACFLLCAIILGVYIAKTQCVYRERLQLKDEAERGRLVIDSQTQLLSKQRLYIDETAKHLHEYRSMALLAMHNIERMELKKALELLERYSGYNSRYKITPYSDNETLDALLSCFAGLAKDMGFEARYTLEGDLERLGLESGVLASLVTNLLENALEANARLAEKKRDVYFSMRRHASMLLIECENPYDGPLMFFRSTKRDKSRPHGYGLRVVNGIAKSHGGGLSTRKRNGIFHISVDLVLGNLKKA